MGLRLKFNLVLLAVFLLGLGVSGYISYELLHKNARDEVLRTAGVMMEAALSMRSYTVGQVRPHLRVIEDEFLPQQVPAFGATEIMNQLRKKYPDYSYKEAALNPTNPADRATNWESDVIHAFKNDPKLAEFVGIRETATGQFLTFARPFRLTDKACLACHSTPAAAPPTMVDLYGNSNGFGWQLNDVIGAQIVSVPMSVALGRANRSLLAFVLSLSAVFVVMLVALNVLMHFFVLKPMQQITALARDVSAGKTDVPEYPVKGRDEIASLGRSFNLMHRSLQNAMRMLEGT
jgi:protein-histidine pros-kinase